MSRFTFAFASLLLAGSIGCASTTPAPAAPVGNTPPATPVAVNCSLDAPVVYRRVMTSTASPTRTLELHSSGAWTDKGGEIYSGCLDGPVLAEIERQLTAAPFTVTLLELRCMAEDPFKSASAYEVHGHHVFTRVMCGNESLDGASDAALTATDRILDADIATQMRHVEPDYGP